MRRTQRKVSIPDLVRAMIEGGASFHLSAGGTWRVDGLAFLPCDLRDEFYQVDEAALAAHLRRMTTESKRDRAA